MHALLKGRGTIPAGLGPIGDLLATYIYPDGLELAFSRPANAVDEFAQIWREGTQDRGPMLDLDDPETVVSLEEGNVYNVIIIPENATGTIGPRSNIARFDFSTSGVTPRDAKMATFLGNSAANLGVDLDAMTGGALTRSVGDLMVIIAHQHLVSTIVPTRMTLPDDWLEASFVAAASGSDVLGYRGIYKVCDGTETVVPMIDSVSTTGNQRVNYHAFSFSFLGSLELGSPVPAGQVTSGDPAAKTLEVAKEGTDTVLAFASQGGTSAVPGVGSPTTWTVMPSFRNQQDQTTTTTNRTGVIYRIFPAPSTKIDMVVDCGDNGINSVGFFYLVFRGGA